MKRFPLMVASGAIGLALLAGVTREVTAAPATRIPPSGGKCFYYLYTCSFENGSYYSDCTPGGSPGWISTASAAMICSTFNEA